MMYYNHNMHFLASANAMNGNYKLAIKWSRELEKNVVPALDDMPMLEMFSIYPPVAMVRFAKWDEIPRRAPAEKRARDNDRRSGISHEEWPWPVKEVVSDAARNGMPSVRSWSISLPTNHLVTTRLQMCYRLRTNSSTA